MRKPSLASAATLAAVLAIGPLSAGPLAGQTPGTTSKSPAALRTKWTAPRTPWGDPDLQGNYTNVYENGTPLERPEQFAGRKLEEVTGDELTTIKRDTQRRTIANFEGPIHAPDHWWQDALFLERGSQAWLVVDPPDGRIPPVTPDAQARITAVRNTRAASGHGPADSVEDRSLYDRCITRGFPGSMMPAIYGNSYRIVQGQGYVAIQYEMIHETRVIPIEARPHSHIGKSIHLHMGGPTRPLGGRHAGRRNDQLRPPKRLSQRQPRCAAPDGALHADLPGQGAMVGHGERSNDMDTPLDVFPAVDDERQRADHAVRVSRRKLRSQEYPQRGSRRGSRGAEARAEIGPG
jgi:hypothetical protein